MTTTTDWIRPAGGGPALTLAEACAAFDVGTVVERHGTWAVTDWGLASLQTSYHIPAERLHTSDWCDHMAEKRWVVAADFRAAYAAACAYHAPGRRRAA